MDLVADEIEHMFGQVAGQAVGEGREAAPPLGGDVEISLGEELLRRLADAAEVDQP